jgi:hypothetical protein
LKTLPAELANVKSLRRLDLDGTRISSIPQLRGVKIKKK